MNDRIDNDTIDASGADDRIDALARSAGSALRRQPSADQLVRIHRAKRNQQIARAAGGTAAVLALVGGGVLLMNRDTNDRIVPATVPSTVAVETVPTTAPVTVGSTVPTSTPVSTPVSTPTSTPVSTPTTDPPTTTSPPVGQPEFLYVGNPLTSDLSEQVVDPSTGEVVRTQDRSGTPYPGNWLERLTRTDSAQLGITYGRQDFADLGPDDFIDLCGQGRVVVENAPAGEIALPDRATDVTVSPDGRWVVVMSAACPVDGEMVVGVGVPADMPPYDVDIEVYDADDPTAAGRPLTTFTTAIALLPQVRYSEDGRWLALTDLGEASGRALEVYDLETAQAVDLGRSGDECTTLALADQDALFVGTDTIAELRRCFDQVVVQITDLSDPTNAAQIAITNLGTNNDPWGTLEVWPNIPADVRQATFVASVGTIGGLDSGQTFFGTAGEVRELPFDATHISFSPLPPFIGGS